MQHKNEYLFKNNYVVMIIRRKKTGEVFRVLFDKEDFETVNQHRWYVSDSKSNSYIRTTIYKNGKKAGSIRLHRLLMNTPKELVVDHANGNTFDNRRENLRNVTHELNSLNKTRYKKNKTGVRGVYPQPNGTFLVMFRGESQGTFEALEEAKEVRQRIVKAYQKEKWTAYFKKEVSVIGTI